MIDAKLVYNVNPPVSIYQYSTLYHEKIIQILSIKRKNTELMPNND